MHADPPQVIPAERPSGVIAGSSSYVLVVQAESSRRVPLPAEGRLIVGSGEAAAIRVGGVAPELAELDLQPDEARLAARPGERVVVNGEPLRGTRALTSGDVIALGEATLVFHRAPRLPRARRALSLRELRDRLHQETERSLRGLRPLALLAVELDEEGRGARRDLVEAAVFGALRFVDLVGWDDDGTELLVVLPETGEAASIPSQRLLEALATLAPGARAGLALCPADTPVADALITGARGAAQGARPGEVARVRGEVYPRPVAGQKIVAVDPMTRSLLALAERLARSDIPVLVSGETGVGKELVAMALHHWSARHDQPLVTINCAAVAESLFESELFGHERGAFTGAVSSKRGLLEAAGAGTVVLDEIGECPLASQAKLLRVIETRCAGRVGAVGTYAIEARFVAVTNRWLGDEVAAGRFRRDLFYRLSAASLVVPPLRDRTLEIPVLARVFLAEACRRHDRPPMDLSAAAVQRLCLHDWPGNVRELKNLMDFCAATVDGPSLGPEHVPAHVGGSAPPWLLPREPRSQPPATFRSIREEVRELERTRMEQALARAGGVRTRAAALIDMPLRTFVTKLRVYGLAAPPPGVGVARGG
jgi:DNA-binding NtrC family response regulator